MPLFEFPQLDAPPGALERVVARGRRRRWAESIATVSAVVVIVVGGALVLVSGANQASGPAKVGPANHAPSSGIQAGRSAPAGGEATQPLSSGPGTSDRNALPSQPSQSQRLAGGPQAPMRTPTVISAVSSTDPSACSYYVEAPSLGWCQLVTISSNPRAGSDATIAVKVCRMADAGSGTLRINPGVPIRFDVSASVDSPSDPVWSARHDSNSHLLSAAAGQCWSWSRVWNVTDSHGKPLSSCSAPWNLYGRVDSPDLGKAPYGQTQFTPNPPRGSGQPDCQPVPGSPLR